MTTIESPQSRLGPWPADIIDQREWVSRLSTYLNAIYDYINLHASDVVTIEDVTVPNQAAWETAYTTQTGKALPIPPNAVLIWWDSLNNRLGGIFGTTTASGTVLNRAPRYAPGQLVYIDSDHNSTLQTIAVQVGEPVANLPVLNFTLPVRCHLEVYGSAYFTIAANSGPFGWDVWLDGIKVGTAYHGVPSDAALFQSAVASLINGRIDIPNVDAGAHTLEMLIGYSGAQAVPVQVTVGGATSTGNGLVHLLARGIAQ